MFYREKLWLLREVIGKAGIIKEINIQGFKSLRNVRIQFPTNLTIVVGPNGSGKTALIESILLLKEILDYIKGRNPNPFGKWWGYRNVVWMGKTERPIRINLTVDLSNLLNILESIENKLEKKEVYGISSFMVDSLRGIVEKSRTIGYSIEVYDRGGIVSVREMIKADTIDFKMQLTRNSMKILYSSKKIEPLKSIEISPLPRPYLLLDKYIEFTRLINAGIPVSDAFENILDDYGYLLNLLKDYLEVPKFIVKLLPWTVVIFGTIIDGITCIREVDLKSIRSPQPLIWYDYLEYNVSNLIPVLYKIGRGRLTDAMEHALQVLFENTSVSGFFSLTPEGTVFFKLAIGDLELPPPSIPNGVWKVLAIEAALALNPTILLIDEFENSLHARVQEYLLDEIRESGVTAIVATHSPVPVDYTKDLREILVLENIGCETKASRLENVEELNEKLRKLGITASEALLYGFIKN